MWATGKPAHRNSHTIRLLFHGPLDRQGSQTVTIRTLTAAAAIAALALATAACGSPSSSSSQNSEGGKTLTYWASNTGTSLDHDKEVLTPQLKKFEEKTGIKVDLEVIGWNDLQTRIQTAVTSGQAPDVVNIGNTWASSLQSTGAFLPMDEDAMKAVGGSDKFLEAALETAGAPGQVPTSLPLYGMVYGLYYNKAMFAEAGLQPPKTYEEMVSAAKKLTKGGQFGLSLRAGSYSTNAHFAFLNSAQNGAELFDADGKPTFASDGVVAGVKRYLDLMQSEKVVKPSDVQVDSGQGVHEFAAGKVPMILGATIDSAILADGMKAEEYGVVPYPAPAGAKDIASFPAGINLSVFKNTKNKDGALKFVEFMTSSETQTALNDKFGTLPVLKGAKPTFLADTEKAKVLLDIYATQSKPLPLVAAEDQFESTVGKAMTQLFSKVASGSTVNEEEIRGVLETAQQQVAASAG
ncbi:sugar ABC transporter substrate-binding protein [Arthrobacter pascens]|nr:sugar ABC transporter substrate-binding protein [Arthrobacter pascens]